MSITLYGYVRHHPPHLPAGSADTGVFDIQFIERCASIHEQAGFDAVLIGHAATHPDGWQVASHIAHTTRRLGVLIATRPGFTQPTIVARQAITLETIAGPGRVGMHIITGGDELDQKRDGDFVAHDDRYRRSGEFMEVLRKVWQDDRGFDHTGEFYRFAGARSALRPAAPNSIKLCFAGRSEPALQVGLRYADTYLIYGEKRATVHDFIASMRARAAPYGRCPDFGLALRLVVGRTEADAWDKAHAYVAKAESKEGEAYAAARTRLESERYSSVGQRLLHRAAMEQEVHDERLWMGYSRQVGGTGTSSALVGSADQVCDSLMRYYDLGVRVFYLRGWDLCEDTASFGERLIPMLHDAVRQREAA